MPRDFHLVNRCAREGCPTHGHQQKAGYLTTVVLAEGHSKGKQKKFEVFLCFECYYAHKRNAEPSPLSSDYPKREVCAR